MQQDVARARMERGLDAGDGLDLSLGQPLRLRLAREPAPLGGHPPLAAACPRPRCDECERPGGSRPVVVRDPERELDELGRHAVDDGAGGGQLDAVRRTDADVDDDASQRAAAEANRDDVASLDLVRHLVRERTPERPSGDERVDLGEGHRSKSLRALSEHEIAPGCAHGAGPPG